MILRDGLAKKLHDSDCPKGGPDERWRWGAHKDGDEYVDCVTYYRKQADAVLVYLKENDDRLAARRRQLPRAPSPIPNAAVLHAARKAKRLTLIQIADYVGVTKSAVGLWEHGLREPVGENRTRYLESLGLLDPCAEGA